MNNKLKNSIGIAFFATFCSCTNLEETVYSEIVTTNYYNTRQNVIQSTFRPFEHAYFGIRARQSLYEGTADVVGIWQRGGWWYDAGRWEFLHKHTWDSEQPDILAEWEMLYTGIMQCASVIEDLSVLDPAQFDMAQDEMNNFIAQNRTLRAMLYIRALDGFRNVPLAVSTDDNKNSKTQVAPQVIFDFVEEELKWSIENLVSKSGNEGNGVKQGQWTKAGAAALLVRLYLNAEKWIGIPKYTECTSYAQKIIAGDYGYYSTDEPWDKVFDWDNEKSKEVIFAFSATNGSTVPPQYDSDVWGLPARSGKYFGTIIKVDPNGKYAVQPSQSLDGTEYNFELGKFVAKFQKYPLDYRLTKYKNKGNNQREGMFLFGKLEYVDVDGSTKNVEIPDNPGNTYDLQDKGNALTGGTFHVGWGFVKYPLYSDTEDGKYESDYVEIRLSEVVYSLAECKFREGNITEAGRLLNTVRKRNFPNDAYSSLSNDYLYKPEGNVELTAAEFLDEWGREFLGEGRRRTDLIRLNKFCEGTWWEKVPDNADKHTEIFPIPYKILKTNNRFVQNVGYSN